jgi:hypothetical protein
MAVSLGDWTFQDNVVVSSSSSKWPFFMDILTLKEEMTRLYQYIRSPSDAPPHSRGMDISYHKVIRSSDVTDFTSAVFVSLLTSAHALPCVSNRNTSSILFCSDNIVYNQYLKFGDYVSDGKWLVCAVIFRAICFQCYRILNLKRNVFHSHWWILMKNIDALSEGTEVITSSVT